MRRRTLATTLLCGLLLVGAWWSTDDATRRSAPADPSSPARVSRARGALVAGAPDAIADGVVAALVAPAQPTAPAPRPGRRIHLRDAEPLPGEPGDALRAALALHQRELGLERMPGELVDLREFESLGGHHLRLRQVIDGVPVLQSMVAAHVDHELRPFLLTADVFPLEGVTTTPVVEAREAKRIALDLLLDGDEEPAEAAQVVVREPELWLVPEGGSGYLAWRVTVRTADESARVLVDAIEGEPRGLRSTWVAASGWAKVFDPNPVHSTRDTRLADDRDRDSQTLTDARVLVELRNLDGSGLLRGTWVDLTPTPERAFRNDLDWRHVTRADPDFEQLVCYQVVNDLQEDLQRLGFTNVNAEAQACNAHVDRRDQSYYDDDLDRLNFGDGGVDDAEDADIVRHEYGHAIQYDQLRDFPGSGEGGAIGEGFGDFLAVAFRSSGNDLFDAAVASWDATSYSGGPVPALRRVDESKVYPDDLEGFVHADGELWSRVLWDVMRTIGRDEALRLVIESHFLYTPRLEFRDAANALLTTNFVLRDGADDEELREILLDRGIFFSVPPRPPVDEDEFEPNDSLPAAVPLALGTYRDLMLADEDWFEVTVSPNSRLFVQAQHDPDEVQLDLELRTTGGGLLARSNGLGPTDSVATGVGPEGATIKVRVFDGSPGVRAGGYTLTLGEGPLEQLPNAQTQLLDVDEGGAETFAVVVGPEDVLARRKLVVVARKKGRKGGKMDLALVGPDGLPLFDFGDKRKRFGSRLKLVPDQAGTYVLRVRPRPGKPGRFKLKAKLK